MGSRSASQGETGPFRHRDAGDRGVDAPVRIPRDQRRLGRCAANVVAAGSVRLSAVYFRVAGANNFIVRDARVLLASPWSRWRPTMRPYSMDLRERVAAAIDAGEGSQRQVAKRFRVSVSFVTRLVQRRRDSGTLAPKPHGGGPRPALGFPERVRLAVRIAEHPRCHPETT